MCTGLQRKRDLFFAPQRFDVSFGSPQNQMFTGLQRKRHLFFTPQSSDDTFALRPGRNGCFFCKRSPVCSENVDFLHPLEDLKYFYQRMFTGLQSNDDSNRRMSPVCSENNGFFHPLGDLKCFYQRMFNGLQSNDHSTTTKIAECHWSAAKTKSVFELQTTCFFFISINLQ